MPFLTGPVPVTRKPRLAEITSPWFTLLLRKSGLRNFASVGRKQIGGNTWRCSVKRDSAKVLSQVIATGVTLGDSLEWLPKFAHRNGNLVGNTSINTQGVG